MAQPVHPKVKAAGIAGSVTTIIVTLLAIAGVNTPPEVAAWITSVVAYAAGYWKAA